ncbi:MAG: hypothetical protein JWN29_2267, partial [Acidimicrobiales bacterium]|nr:hypothetical protein [Acidimicrobiales bacterium]
MYPPPAPLRDLRSAIRLTAAVGLVLALVLAGTGLGLWFNYRPTAPTVGVPRLRTIHRAASSLLVLDAVAFLVLVVVDSRRRWPRGVWAVVTVLALAYTGSLLP